MANSSNSILSRTMKIITVSGPDNSGKTTLIQYVFQKLISDGGKITYYEACGARVDDFNAVIVWHGKIIAFCSIGDKPDYGKKNENGLQNIENGIRLADQHFVDILLNARTEDISEVDYKNCLEKHFGNDFYIPIKLCKPNSLETLIKNQQLSFELIMREV